MRRYTVKHDAYIVENASIMSDKQISIHMGRSQRAIKNRREKLSCFKEPGNDNILKFNRENSKRMEAIGLLNYIQSGANKDAALHRLSELNIDTSNLTIKYRGKVKLRIKAKAYTMYCRGMSTVEIGKELGHSRKSVWEWIKLFKPYIGDSPVTITIKSKIYFH